MRADTDPMIEILGECVVLVECDGEFAGTGFWIAPGEVLTCAHVVHAASAVSVREKISGPAFNATIMTNLLDPDAPASEFSPQPDVALLRIFDPPKDHQCVQLDTATPAIDTDK